MKDAYSKWIETFRTKTITAAFTVSKLRELFAKYGLPDVIVSDAGTQFTAEIFRLFLELNGIKQIMIAPGHPSSNGAAENAVKSFKKMLFASLAQAATNGSSKDVDSIMQRILMDYRSSVHCSTGETPAKIMLGREIRTRLSILKPPTMNESIESSQRKQQSQFNGHRNVRFEEGEEVMIRDYSDVNKPSWCRATIVKIMGERNYLCQPVSTRKR